MHYYTYPITHTHTPTPFLHHAGSSLARPAVTHPWQRALFKQQGGPCPDPDHGLWLTGINYSPSTCWEWYHQFQAETWHAQLINTLRPLSWTSFRLVSAWMVTSDHDIHVGIHILCWAMALWTVWSRLFHNQSRLFARFNNSSPCFWTLTSLMSSCCIKWLQLQLDGHSRHARCYYKCLGESDLSAYEHKTHKNSCHVMLTSASRHWISSPKVILHTMTCMSMFKQCCNSLNASNQLQPHQWKQTEKRVSSSRVLPKATVLTDTELHDVRVVRPTYNQVYEEHGHPVQSPFTPPQCVRRSHV